MMANNYCPECDKDFKSITGFNGHNQFKHNKLPESLVSNNPAGRVTTMLELMKDQMVELKLEIQGLRADLEDETGNPVEMFACADCWQGEKTQYLLPNQEVCPRCKKPKTWTVALI
jgi:hypothetical protein